MKNTSKKKPFIADLILTPDIISDKELDEMQKAVAYKTVFKMFCFTIYSLLLISFIMVLVADNYHNEPLGRIIAVFGIIICALLNVLYSILALRLASKGMIGTEFARITGSGKFTALIIAAGIVYALIMAVNKSFLGHFLYMDIAYVLYYSGMIIIKISAAINNRFIAKMNAEE